MIYRNSLLANHVTWTIEPSPEAAEIARTFLRSECQILRLAAVASNTIAEVESFLTATADVPMSVYRSAAGDLLVRTAGDDLLITGKTAEVLGAYIDQEVVTTEDRLDMTLRRVVGL
ncbi:MAG TPA: hypothetical protein VL284_04265 [Thermoanaerobaculia bacterium]|nr:hypothetical protein [Thermoanaerobaculia bacterium]